MTMTSDPKTIFYVFHDGVKCPTNISYGEAVDFLNTCGITDADRIESILRFQMTFEIDGIRIVFARTGIIAAETGTPSASDVSVVREHTVGVMRDRKEFEDADRNAYATPIRRSTIAEWALSGFLAASVWANLLAWNNAFRVNHHETAFAAFVSFLGFKL